MGWTERRRAILEARALRTELGLSATESVDPLGLATRLGIQTVCVPLGNGDDVEGAFQRRSGRGFILLNASKGGRRVRFTCAHELGHARLLDPGEDWSFVDTNEELDLVKAHGADEREANIFAAELLMPLEGVTAAIDGVEDGEDAVGAVVRAYAVSPKSAAIRLSELEVLDRATAAAVIDRIDNDWRAFWREQRVPADDPVASTGNVTLPEEFVRRAEELLEAQVISPERHTELVDRPLVASE
ncbi:MAG TPA: ImmA/IrrE family metallo-endopeptidase [Dermatophilaceae bacterium]|jgi:Zn-dependent peptidase ImmA (M78 family)